MPRKWTRVVGIFFALFAFVTAIIPGQTLAGTAELTPDEREALEKGEIGQARHIVGALVGTFVVPFGIGQAIEGRYLDTGWIFTLGEVAGISATVAGIATAADTCTTSTSGAGVSLSCSRETNVLFWGGLFTYIGFRIWELVDVWGGPSWHNERYRRAKAKVEGKSAQNGAWSPYVAPSGGDALALGLQLRF